MERLPDSILAALLTYLDPVTRHSSAARANARFRRAAISRGMAVRGNICITEWSHKTPTQALAWLQNAVRARSLLVGSDVRVPLSQPAPLSALWSGVCSVQLSIPSSWMHLRPSGNLVLSLFARLAEQGAPLSHASIGGVRLDWARICEALAAWSNLRVIDLARCPSPNEPMTERRARIDFLSESREWLAFATDDFEQHMQTLAEMLPWFQALLRLIAASSKVSMKFPSASLQLARLHTLRLPPLPSASLALISLVNTPLHTLSLSASRITGDEISFLEQAFSALPPCCALSQHLRSLTLCTDEEEVDRSLWLAALDLPEMPWHPLLETAVEKLPALTNLNFSSSTLTADEALRNSLQALAQNRFSIRACDVDVYLPISSATMAALFELPVLRCATLRSLYRAEHSRFVELAFLKYDGVDDIESAFSAMLLALHSVASADHANSFETRPDRTCPDIVAISGQHHAESSSEHSRTPGFSVRFDAPIFIPPSSALLSLERVLFPSRMVSLILGPDAWMHFEPKKDQSQSVALDLISRIHAPSLTTLEFSFDRSPECLIFSAASTTSFPSLRHLSLTATQRCALPIISMCNALGAQLHSVSIRALCPIQSNEWDALASVCHSLRKLVLLEHIGTWKAPTFLSRPLLSKWISHCKFLKILIMSPALINRLSLPLPSKSSIGKYLQSFAISKLDVFSEDPDTGNCIAISE